jgi:hypothetical protein
MKFVIVDCAQRTPEWKQARLGRVCSSHADAMLATIQKGEAAARRNLRVQLVLERITGRCQERDFQSEDMRLGTQREAEALGLYEALTGQLLCHAGFLAHTDLMCGWSPDGRTLDGRGFVEVKCPKAATHFDALRTGKVPLDYLRQMVHGGFFVGGAEYGDFVSFHPEFPEPLQLFIKRIDRRDLDLDAHEQAVRIFLDEVDRDCQVIRTMSNLSTVLQEATA